jgi:cytochrome b561
MENSLSMETLTLSISKTLITSFSFNICWQQASRQQQQEKKRVKKTLTQISIIHFFFFTLSSELFFIIVILYFRVLSTVSKKMTKFFSLFAIIYFSSPNNTFTLITYEKKVGFVSPNTSILLLLFAF